MEEDKFTLRVFHIEFLECGADGGRRHERFLEQDELHTCSPLQTHQTPLRKLLLEDYFKTFNYQPTVENIVQLLML